MLARAPGFEEALLIVDVDPSDVVGRRLTDARRRSLARERGITSVPVVELGGVDASPDGSRAGEVVPFDDELEQTRRALELALRDYVEKNGFAEVVIAVSGGIDPLTAALAVEALG